MMRYTATTAAMTSNTTKTVFTAPMGFPGASVTRALEEREKPTHGTESNQEYREANQQLALLGRNFNGGVALAVRPFLGSPILRSQPLRARRDCHEPTPCL